MNRVLLMLIALIPITNINGQEDRSYSQIIKKAIEAYKVQDYQLSVDYFENAFQINNQQTNDLFNGACAASLNGDTEKAFLFLDLSINNGYRDLKHIEKDRDLNRLWTMPQWNEVISKVKENQDNYLSSDKVIESIIASFKLNAPEIIWSLGSDSYRQDHNKDSVITYVNNYHNVFYKYNIEVTDLSLIKSNSANTIKSNIANQWSKEELKEFYYIFTPKVLGETTKDFFSKKIGYNINFQLKLQRNVWTLNSMSIKNNYLNESFNCREYIECYLNDTSSVYCQIKIISTDNEIEHFSSFPAKDIKVGKFINSIQWTSLKDITMTANPVVYSLYFIKKTDSKKQITKTTDMSDYLEIIFLDNTDKLIISNGEMYGIYKGNNSKIRSWVMKKLEKDK